MHRLQQHILRQLIFNHTQRYSDLKPANVESNAFVYHLNQLIKDGLVAKFDNGLYSLTLAGQTYADQLSLTSFRPRLQPRIVTLIILARGDGDIMLYRRKRQPLIGMVGFPYGKVHVGETVAAAADRELLEKTGLRANLIHRGDGYITMTQGETVVSQIMFHLFTGSQPQGQLIRSTKAGQAFWSRPNEIAESELMPSVPDLLAASQAPSRFFIERSYQLAEPTPAS